MKNLLFAITALLLFSCQPARTVSIDPYHYTIEKKASYQSASVVSAHPLASRIGVSIMQQGGNAFDAAISTQLALAVVYPVAGNIGGGGFMVAFTKEGKALALDFREMAPGAASRDMYLNEKGEVINGRSVNGHLSAGIPGTVAGIFEMLPYARLPFKKLIQPAIDLARKGYAISKQEADGLNQLQKDLPSYNSLPNAFMKKHWQVGDTLIQSHLANTLERIRDRGRAGFYEGRTAQLIVEEMKRGSGLITLADLQAYQAKWRPVHQFAYRGYDFICMPMPSSGGVLLHQMLKMVEPYPLGSYGFQTAQSVQLMTEVERRAYADRSQHMGDADFFPVPVPS